MSRGVMRCTTTLRFTRRHHQLFVMTKYQSIPRRTRVNWHFARDDYMFTTIKAKDSRLLQRRLKLQKKKQPAKTSKAKGLTVLSEVALTEAEQIKLTTKRSLIKNSQNSHASAQKSSDEEDNDEVAVNDDDDDNDDDNDDADNQNDDGQEYDKHDDEEQGDDNEQTDSDNDGDDFVHPKFSTHDEEDKEKDSFDPQVQTPSHVESTDDEDSDEEIQDVNVEGDKMNEEETNEE
ncbi:hypothetical protein Tco_1401408 [Tanacetum coccineum]